MAPSYASAWVLAGFGVLIFVIGAILYFVHGWQRLKVQASRTWPSVVGTVVASAVAAANSKNSAPYSAAVRYSYRVGGKEYHSERIFWGSHEGSQDAMAELVADYPAGKDVWVQYDPNNPASAVLRPDIANGLSALFYYALGMMGLGIVALGAALYALSH